MENMKESLKEYGLEFEINDNFSISGNIIAVECDLDINLGLDWINKCTLKKVTKRNTNMWCSFNQTEEKLTIKFFTTMPSQAAEYINPELYKHKLATTFTDLCWLYSDGTTIQTINEVATTPRETNDYSFGDLTWVLPSKFVDDLIEMIHTINPEFMSGVMQDTIIYGPYYLEEIKINA